MSFYQLFIDPLALRHLQKLDAETQNQVVEVIESLQKPSLPPGCKAVFSRRHLHHHIDVCGQRLMFSVLGVERRLIVLHVRRIEPSQS